MRLFLLFLFSISLAFGNIESNSTGFENEPSIFNLSKSLETSPQNENTLEEEPPEPEIEAKLLYQSYYELPKKLFKGQVFSLTIKALSAKEEYESIDYEFSNPIGLQLLSDEQNRKVEPPYLFDTFYFQVKGNRVKTPDVGTTLVFKNFTGELKETLRGEKIETVRLNPEKDFSSVLADDFKILEYKTSQYDNQHNIIVFSAEAKMANLQDFSLKVATKEGIEAYEEELPHSNFTYYAVVSKQLNELKFSYFNLGTRRFQDVIIPIVVINDRVSTQTDLAPTQNTHATAKMILAGVVSAIGLALFIYRRKKFYILIFIAPLFIIAKLAVPTKHVCVKEGSNIYLLPMRNGTIFEQASQRFTSEALGDAQNFVKIRMHNTQIGWVKYEDLCQN